ncbi:hypothetical protein [Streptomyces sp. NPDC048710]|uniref:hypothetical protein n=1 Tax=Streptomyces sp. NPDC048710 TaxID=3365586 RepID=UPI00370F99A9
MTPLVMWSGEDGQGLAFDRRTIPGDLILVGPSASAVFQIGHMVPTRQYLRHAADARSPSSRVRPARALADTHDDTVPRLRATHNHVAGQGS